MILRIINIVRIYTQLKFIRKVISSQTIDDNFSSDATVRIGRTHNEYLNKYQLYFLPTMLSLAVTIGYILILSYFNIRLSIILYTNKFYFIFTMA